MTTSGLFVGFTPSNYSSALTINHSICIASQLSDHKPLIPILLWLNPNPTYPTFPSLHHKPIAIPASFYAFWWCPRCGFSDHVIPHHPAAPSLEGLRIAVFSQACGVPVAHRRLDAQLLAFGEHNSNFCDWIYKCIYIYIFDNYLISHDKSMSILNGAGFREYYIYIYINRTILHRCDVHQLVSGGGTTLAWFESFASADKGRDPDRRTSSEKRCSLSSQWTTGIPAWNLNRAPR